MIGVFGDLWGNYCNGSSFACKDSVQRHLACHWLETSCCTCRQWSFCNQPSWKTCVHPGVAVHAASFSIKIIQNHNLHKSGRIQMDRVQFVFFKKHWSLEQDLSLLPHACMQDIRCFSGLCRVWSRVSVGGEGRKMTSLIVGTCDLETTWARINDAFTGVRRGKRMITILHNFANQQLTLPCPATFAGCTCCSPTSSVKTLDLWQTDENSYTAIPLLCHVFLPIILCQSLCFCPLILLYPFVSFLVVSSACSKRIMSCHVHKMLAGEVIPNNSENIAI